MTMAAPLLELKQVHFRYPQAKQEILAEVSLSLSAGDALGIVGASGCGKSTLLRVIAGLLDPTRGERTFQGQNASMAGQIGMVFQDPRLLPWRTVLDNLKLPCELVDCRFDEAKALHLLERVGLAREDVHKYPRMLSGGMKMRVAFARALLLDPPLLLLDEPFAAVDDLLREQLNEDLLAWQQEFGFAFVMVTHHLGEAVYLSRQLLVMSGKPGKISARHQPPWTQIRPELRSSLAFVEFRDQIRQELLKQA